MTVPKIEMTYEIHVTLNGVEQFRYTDDVGKFLRDHDITEDFCHDIRLVRWHADLTDFEVKGE
jgi:hypothetical protein